MSIVATKPIVHDEHTTAQTEQQTVRECLGNPYQLEAWLPAIQQAVATGQFHFHDIMTAGGDTSLSNSDGDRLYYAQIANEDQMLTAADIIQKNSR